MAAISKPNAENKVKKYSIKVTFVLNDLEFTFYC